MEASPSREYGKESFEAERDRFHLVRPNCCGFAHLDSETSTLLVRNFVGRLACRAWSLSQFICLLFPLGAKASIVSCSSYYRRKLQTSLRVVLVHYRLAFALNSSWHLAPCSAAFKCNLITSLISRGFVSVTSWQPR
ncbi:hypothetical protein R1flu_023226 [Riccia fluitans]|uniref:Uncharacterized protein n=1 Tax=Riccia fluitans TaxID=41844 RepID=A0ABD1XRY7_9MARC